MIKMNWSTVIIAIMSVGNVCMCLEDILEYETLQPQFDLDADCIAESMAPEEDVQAIRSISSPTTREGKCLLACIYKKVEILTVEGKHNSEGSMAAAVRALALHPHAMNQAIKLVEICTQKVENMQDDEQGCEIAAALFACLENNGDQYEFVNHDDYEP